MLDKTAKVVKAKMIGEIYLPIGQLKLMQENGIVQSPIGQLALTIRISLSG